MRLKAKIVKQREVITPDGDVLSFVGTVTRVPVRYGKYAAKYRPHYVWTALVMDSRRDELLAVTGYADSSAVANKRLGNYYGHWKEALGV